jgi:hypothetical protein
MRGWPYAVKTAQGARYWRDVEKHRERSRHYYAANREKVLARMRAKREALEGPRNQTCSECGDLLEGRQRVICGTASCRDRRFRRLNPEAYAERERQKVERRRERRRAARTPESGERLAAAAAHAERLLRIPREGLGCPTPVIGTSSTAQRVAFDNFSSGMA